MGAAITYCRLCEAGCGVEVLFDAEGRPADVKPDFEHVVSRGFLCTKARALTELLADPRRVTSPRVRAPGQGAGTWREAGWDEALDAVAGSLTRIARTHGPDAVAVYQGNPTAFAWAAAAATTALARVLGTTRFYTAASIDCAERFAVADLCFGHPLLVTIPDLRRAHFALLLGANPAVSSWAQLTSIPRWLEERARLRARKGTFVVVDPRRTETADLADEHVALRPGSDVELLGALVRTILAEGLEDRAFLEAHCTGLDKVRRAVEGFTLARAAEATGIDAGRIERLARAFATAPSGFAAGHSGLTMQRRGSIAEWLLVVLNAVAGRLDRAGGCLVNPGLLDWTRLGDAVLDRFAPLPPEIRPPMRRILDDLPCSTLVDAIEAGQVRALVVAAGNPAVTFPEAARVRQALARLECLVGIDPYVNETLERAHVVLPPLSMLERDDGVLLNSGFLAEPYAQFTRAVCTPPPGVRSEWWIAREIVRRLGAFPVGTHGDSFGRRVRKKAARALSRWILGFEPETVLRFLLRAFSNTSLGELERHPHGLRLGDLREGDLRARVKTRDRKIQLAPLEILALLGENGAAPSQRAAELDSRARHPFTLLSRRRRGAMNSWLEGLPSSRRVDPVPWIEVAPGDAARLGIEDGSRLALVNDRGRFEGKACVTSRCPEGIVTAPHSRFARDPVSGVSNLNDLTGAEGVDPLTGMPAFHATRVRIVRVESL